MACPNDVQRSLPNGTQLRSFLPALPRPTVHSPEAVFTVESTEKTVSYNETVRPYEILPILFVGGSESTNACRVLCKCWRCGSPKRSEITRTIGTDILESETGTKAGLLFPVLT